MGEHGWKSLVPFYNSYILFQHAFGNGIWFLVTFVPGVGIIATMLVNILICLRFNRNEALMIVASMLSFGYIIVGFDHSVYTGDKQL
jgi:hypothetical protein